MSSMKPTSRGMPETDDAYFAWVRSLPDFPTALRELRAMQDLTEDEVGRHAGCSKSYVQRLEHGLRKPERDTVLALLLGSFSLPVYRANPLIVLAGYAPMHQYHIVFVFAPVRQVRQDKEG